MKIIQLLLQIVALGIISFAGNVIADAVHMGIPGSIIGIVILLVLIQLKIIPLEKIELGANFLIAELLLFFIPSAIGVIQFQEILKHDWSQLLFSISGSVICLVLFVSMATEAVVRLRERRGA